MQEELIPSTSSINKKKDILVSIVLTESTSNLLELELPHVEKLDTDAIETAIEAAKSTDYKNSQHSCAAGMSHIFTEYWFGKDTSVATSKKHDSKEVSQEVAYFAENSTFDESRSSLELESGSQRKQHSSTVLQERLRPTTVFTRPLLAVRSLPDSTEIKTTSKSTRISIQTSEDNLDTVWSNVCRICHGGESNGNLVAPCDCRGSIALCHLECLERWLRESANSRCELCNHHYVVIQEPRYSIPKSIFLFLRYPGDHLADLLFDILAFVVYTPAAAVSTYMLVLLCETVAKSNLQYSTNASSHIVTVSAILGMAAIDFTYSSWLMVNLQKHFIAWKIWYRNNSRLKIILPVEKETHNTDSHESDVD